MCLILDPFAFKQQVKNWNIINENNTFLKNVLFWYVEGALEPYRLKHYKDLYSRAGENTMLKIYGFSFVVFD